MKKSIPAREAVLACGLVSLTALCLPATTLAQDPFAIEQLDPAALSALNPRDAAGVILNEMTARDRARKSSVSQYGVRSHTALSQMTAGFGVGDPSTLLLHEKVFCVDPATGRRSFTWRLAPPGEVVSRVDEANPNGLNATSGEMRAAAAVLAEQGATINGRLANEGVPVGLLQGLGEPMADQTGMNVLDPADYFSAYALFFSVAADQRDLANDPNRGEAPCTADASTSAAVNDRARYAGQETIDGRPAVLVEMNGLDRVQTAEGNTEVTIDTVSIAIDVERAVPLRTRFEGQVEQGRDSRPITIEKRELDYRAVPGADMYESYRQVLSIAGWSELGPEAAEAQKQMAELEKQLASVPPAQRAMMERMLGNQLEMVRKMASGGAIELEVIVDEIVVNPGIPGGPPNAAAVGVDCRPDQTVLECLEGE